MKRLFLRVLIPAVMLAFATTAPAMKHEGDKGKDSKPAATKDEKGKAEKGQATRKVLLENDKVTVFEVSFKPGEENKAVPSSSYRVVRAIKGGTLTRTYADGKTEKIEYKAGDVRFNEPSKQAYTAKNTGKEEVVLYVVVLKQAK